MNVVSVVEMRQPQCSEQCYWRSFDSTEYKQSALTDTVCIVRRDRRMSYFICFKPCNLSANRRCTFKVARSMSFFRLVDQIIELYSRTERTYTIDALINELLSSFPSWRCPSACTMMYCCRRAKKLIGTTNRERKWCKRYADCYGMPIDIRLQIA